MLPLRRFPSSLKADGNLTESMSEQRLQRLNEQLAAARKEAEARHPLMGLRDLTGGYRPLSKFSKLLM